MSLRESIARQIDRSTRIHRGLGDSVDEIATIVTVLVETFRSGGRVFFFGNGGSAADAQHWAGELSGRFYHDRPPLPALSLTTNTSALTAIANDDGYEEIFVRQLAGAAESGDVAVGISTSGNSSNVVRALRFARESDLTTVAFTGEGGGEIGPLSRYWVEVPSDDVARVQEGHLLCGHLVCSMVEEVLFGNAELPG